jgi:hypothetical protein
MLMAELTDAGQAPRNRYGRVPFQFAMFQ